MKKEQFQKMNNNNFRSALINSDKLSIENNVIKGYAVCTRGLASGKNLFLDDEFLNSIVALGNSAGESGVRVHFGHPENDTEALAKMIGYATNFKLDNNIVRADMHLLDINSENGKQVLSLATKMPAHFGSSIMFSRDTKKEDQFKQQNCKDNVFTSPDSDNVENFVHARLCTLMSSDIVAYPAANKSFFSSELKLDEKINMFKLLQEDNELINFFKEQEKEMEKPHDLERFKQLKDRFKDDLPFAVAQFEKGNDIKQAENEFKDVEIAKLKELLAKKESEKPAPVEFGTNSKPSTNELIKEYMKEKKVSFRQAANDVYFKLSQEKK